MKEETEKQQTVSVPVEPVVIKPCPFCGGDANFFSNDFDISCVGKLVIACGKCNARVSENFILNGHCRKNSKDSKGKSSIRIVNRWNKRTL